ncbi:C-type lectin domain family 4 member E-like isoform X2 [Megalobrama amblycephala]|uniref:C-type lectin domain family 4 member E-like isoform X2 n=1 Tax=Megalobrama amblycephala TaxID=75352 RepID=UPI0020144A80|nr:C-type lectin domain family 4 member E-like isoform X2 [Megalobrama amblycephala]
MELDTVYENVDQKHIKDTSGPQIHRHDEGQAQKQNQKQLKRGSRCLVLMTVCLGIICVVLLVFIILQHISITAEREAASKKSVFFISNESKNWSDSRQYCRDRGTDLVIIDTEEKQRLISSFIKETVWIGLSDIENEGNMKWVDNSPLKQGFWIEGEPNNLAEDENCIELIPEKPTLNNWNDLPCSYTIKWICEK